jgi:hypothetical protein
VNLQNARCNNKDTQLCILNCTGNVVWNTNGRRIWVEQLMCMVNRESAYKIWVQGGSNMTGTDCGLFTHNQSRSHLNHLVYNKTGRDQLRVVVLQMVQNINMCLITIVCAGEDWIRTGHSRVQERLLKGNMRRLP